MRHDFYGFPSEQNGFLALYDFDAALATGNVQDGFIFASNFDPTAVPGAAGLNLNISDRKSIVPSDYNNLRAAYRVCVAAVLAAATSSFAEAGDCFTSASPVRSRTRCGRARRSSASCSSTTRAAGTRFRTTCRPSRCRTCASAFDDGEPILVGDNDPDTEFEAFETQMVSSELQTPYMHQWNLTTQWEFRPNWLLEAGYVGSKGSKLLQWANLNQAIDVETVGLLEKAWRTGRRLHGELLRSRR